MICPNKLDKEINESDMDYGPIEGAVIEDEYYKRLANSVRRAKELGYYVDPAKRELFVIDKAKDFVGKTLPLEELDTGNFKDVFVKKAEMIAQDMVSVNDGELVLDLKSKSTRDGKYMMGSEFTNSDGEIEMMQLTGTVLADIDELLEDMNDTDGNAISNEHKEYLKNVVEKYKNTLTQASKDVEFTLEAYQSLSEKVNTYGTADPKLGKIKLVLGNQKNNSLSEILAHEFQHVLLREVIGKDKYLEYNILKLREALKKHFNEKYKGEGWKVFVEGRKDADIADAKKKFEYAFDNNEYPADEFLAYATTNEQLVKQLGLIKNVETNVLIPLVKETGKWTKLYNTVARMVNKIYNVRITGGKNGAELALSLLDTALRKGHNQAKKEDQGVFDNLVDKISNVDEKIAKYTGAIKKEYASYDEYLRSKKDDKLRQAIDKIWKIRGLARVRSALLQNNIFNSVTRDISNPEVAKFYEMFRKSKAFIDKEVVAVKTKTAQVLDDVYGFKQMDASKKRALKRVLMDLDVNAIGDIEVVEEYLNDMDKLNADIDEGTSKYSKEVLVAMDQLAELLVSNTISMKNGYVNASQIALGELRTRDDDVIEDIDRLVSMIALTKLDENDRNEAKLGIEQNRDGVKHIITLKKINEEEILNRAYFGDKMYQVKGAKQDVYDSRKKHYLVDETEMKELVKAGLVNVGEHNELSRITGKKTYIVIGESIDVAYTEGLMSTVQLKSEGDSLKHMLKEQGLTDEEIEEKIEALASETGMVRDGSSLVPERSGNGEVYDYRIRLSYEAKSSYLDLDDNIVTTLASTMSNLTHKQEAMVNNSAALNYFDTFYKSYKHSNKYKFVEISKDSEGKLKEYWDQMPFYLKRELKRMNHGKLMIEESMLIDFFGYKDVSLVNAPWVKNRVKRQLVMKKIESIVQELIKSWKTALVAYTGKTIQGNMLSNMVVALQHTKNKNPVEYLKKFKEVWEMMDDYIADRDKMLELKIRLKSGDSSVVQRQIDSLNKKMKANPVSIVIEDGQYTAIMEDLDGAYFGHKGIVAKKVDDTIARIKNTRKREQVKELVDFLYIREDSRIHNSVMKLTNYSDVVNKMIILMDIMEKNGGKYTQADLNYLDQLHVNYGYLDNRFIKYANDVGFLTFTKYMFRVFPAMMKLLGNKAFTVMLTEGTIKATGLGETPFKQFYNPLDSMARKASLWSDPVDVLKELTIPHAIPYI